MSKNSNSLESSVVSWSRIQGNKFLKALHPAMLSKHGYAVRHKVRLVGEPKEGSRIANMRYDRNYVVCWLQTKFVRVLLNEGLDELINLVTEAYNKAKSPEQKNLCLPFDPDD